MKTKVFFALNSHTMQITLLYGFPFWEFVQGAFRCGIEMPGGVRANGIGSCKSVSDFTKRCLVSGYTIVL